MENLSKGIVSQSYPHELVKLWFVSNGKDDGAIETLRARFNNWEGNVEFIYLPENLGFTGGNNEALKRQESPYVLLLNPDTCMEPDCLEILVKTKLEIPNAGIIEGSQKPSEIKKLIDSETLETSWCALSCALIKRESLYKTGLLDNLFFAYCEDIDLSWRMWLNGYKCIHQKRAEYWHYTNDPIRNNNTQLFFCTRNLFFIRWIYGGKFKAYLYILYCIIRSFVRRSPIKEGKIMRSAVFDMFKSLPKLSRHQAVNRNLNKWINFKQRSLFPCKTLFYG